MSAGAVAPDVLLRAFAALGKLVAAQYPERFTLTEIAVLFGSNRAALDGGDMGAIRAVESYLTALPGGQGPEQCPACGSELLHPEPVCQDCGATTGGGWDSPLRDEGPVPGDGQATERNRTGMTDDIAPAALRHLAGEALKLAASWEVFGDDSDAQSECAAELRAVISRALLNEAETPGQENAAADDSDTALAGMGCLADTEIRNDHGEDCGGHLLCVLDINHDGSLHYDATDEVWWRTGSLSEIGLEAHG